MVVDVNFGRADKLGLIGIIFCNYLSKMYLN